MVFGGFIFVRQFRQRRKEELNCKIMTVTFVMEFSDVVLAWTGTQTRLSRVVSRNSKKIKSQSSTFDMVDIHYNTVYAS
jgi:hypothetical protein